MRELIIQHSQQRNKSKKVFKQTASTVQYVIERCNKGNRVYNKHREPLNKILTARDKHSGLLERLQKIKVKCAKIGNAHVQE